MVCDQERFEVHTNWPNTRKQVYSFTLSDMLRNEPTQHCALPPLDVLHALFEHPEELRPDAPSARVTEKAATEFAKLAENLNVRRIDPEKAAHFLMRLLFCLFADSIGLLPNHIFRRMIEIYCGNPLNFNRKLRRLFAAMAQGDAFGADDVPFFNGGLFADDSMIELSASELAILRASSTLDWSRVEPAIFGTLFERSFDPTKRSQLGAHYTSKQDILAIIDPVLVAPLRKRWEEVKVKATALSEAADKQSSTARNKLRKQLEEDRHLLGGRAVQGARARPRLRQRQLPLSRIAAHARPVERSPGFQRPTSLAEPASTPGRSLATLWHRDQRLCSSACFGRGLDRLLAVAEGERHGAGTGSRSFAHWTIFSIGTRFSVSTRKGIPWNRSGRRRSTSWAIRRFWAETKSATS